MHDLARFLDALGDVPSISDPIAVRRKSRDMTAAFSPVMRRELKDKFADVIVAPRDKADVLKIAAAAAAARMPLICRGAGTGNFGQGIPLKGGAVVDMTGLDRIVRIEGPVVRAETGARLSAIDAATRPTGYELRMHSSTKHVATLGGFVGGGHAGVGSCVHGILRDRGNIRAIEVVSVEETPRVVELRGEDVNLVHHAYGANGLITEIEMPLTTAWPWIEAIVLFDDFMDSVRFSHALAVSDGIVKKLISLSAWPIPGWIRPLAPFVKEGKSMVLAMIAEHSFEAFEGLVAEGGGIITAQAPEGQGPYGAPIYEFAWGHTRFHVNKEMPAIVSAVGLYDSADPVADIEKSWRRFRDHLGMHFEVKRFDGKLSFQGSPYFEFVDDAQIGDVMAGMAEDGAMVANSHTFKVKQGGMKEITARDIAFKRDMDPYDLCNPGKLSFGDAEIEAAGDRLPGEGWRYQRLRAS